MVGPGILEIPPIDHGAVEILIWDLAEATRALGHEVEIINEPDLRVALEKIKRDNFDVVHCEYDNHVAFFNQHLPKEIPFVSTSHYGFINQPHYWDPNYYNIYKELQKCPNLISLSVETDFFFRVNRISDQKEPYPNQYILRNGTTVNKFRFAEEGNGKCLILGKIEARKYQGFCNQYCPTHLEFAGPKVMDFVPTKDNKYIGTMTKKEVYENLTNYSALMLLSLGECAALVIPEALASGLSVIVSKEAAANLPHLLPFITVLDLQDPQLPNNLHQITLNVIEQNKHMRKAIRLFAEGYFSWDVIVKDYINILEQIIKNHGL